MANKTSQKKIDQFLADYESSRKSGGAEKISAGKGKSQYQTSQDKISGYLKEHEEVLKNSPSRQQMIALEFKATEEAARKKAQLQANVQQALREQAIDSVESQALAAIKQRLNQGLGEFRQTDLQQGPFSGYQDPVELALNAQDLKGVGPQKTWRAEALKLGQQAVEQRRQEYAQQGSVKDYAERFKQKQTVVPDEKERTENAYKYAQEVPYMADFEEISSKEGANTKRKRTEEEAKKYEEEIFWAEVNGSAAPVILGNQEQDLIDKYVSDQQLKVYNYLVNSGQQEYADEYWRGVKSYAQAARNAADIKSKRDALAKLPEGFVRDTASSALSVGANMVNAVTSTYYIAEQEIREALTGERQELDPQDAAFQAGRVRDALRQDVSEKLPGWGKFLYETGMSITDTMVMGLLLGPTGGALLMGSGAAADTVRDVKERGGSDQQALTMGLIAGGAELLTEKLGFDRLGNLVGGSKGNVFRQVLGAIVSEAGEEGATEIANILTDVLVMGDASEYDALVRQYMAQGMSEDGARRQAFKDLAVQVGLATLGGGLSGGAMGSGAAVVGTVARAAEQTAQRNAWREAVDYDAATNIFTEGARGGSTYENMRLLAEQAYDRQQETAPQSSAATASLGKGEPDALPASRTVDPTIERMAQEYGEDASVFKSHYNGSDPEQYKRGFDAMFNAGRSGLSLEMLGGVSDQLTAGMDEATKQSIYTAGRNRAANTITPGAKNLTTKKLTSEQRTFLRVWDAIGKEYGFEVDLVDDVKDANGAYRRGGRRIVVSANATEGALTHAAGHETVHYLKSVNPEGYSVLEDTVLRYLTDEDSMFDLETAIKERMKEYAGKNPTREEAIEEIVAEAVPTFFSDRAAATEFANRNPTLAEKIRDFFYDFVKKIREIAERYMQSQNRDEIANLLNKTEALTEIARTLDAGLRGAKEKPAGKTDGEVVTARKKEIKGADDVSKWRPENQFMNEYMTTTERRLFDAHLRNTPKKKWPRSKDGYSIVEAGRALVYTDYAKLNPKVNRVVYFYIDDGTELSGAMHIWRKGEKEGVDNDRNREVVESYYGDGCVVVYHYDDWREAAREDEGRKGADGSGAGGRSQEDGGGGEELKFSLKDNTAFARWFGDSKIVNADGTPKVMYHGSQASFTAFDKKKARSSGLYGRGFYFTDSDTHAGQYGSLYQVYLKVENPLTPDGSTVTKAQVKKFLEAVAENEDDYSIENYGTYDVDEIMKKVYKKDAFAVIQDINATAIGDMVEAVKLFNEVNGTEFDGIVVPTETVVFEPTQIKSATDNVGTFDPEDPDIRFSLKTEEQKEREKADRGKNKQVQKAQAEDWQQVSAGEIMVQDLTVDEETVRRQASGALNKGLRDKLNQQIGMAANRILRDTESKYGRDELKKKLHEIVKQYAAHGNVTLAAEELAGAVIDQSVRLKQSEAAEQYADVREQLRNAHISLTETQRQEVANEYGSVDAYRKAVFGTMNVRSEGMTLESLWDELSGQHPEIFPPDTNEAQMPGVIAQFDQMMKPRYENIHGMDTAAAVTDLALRIQGDVLGMVGAKNAAHDLYVRADTFREQVRREYDREIRAQQKARVDEFQQIAGKLKAAKDRGDDEARKKIMAEYRKALNKVDTRTAISEVRAANRVRNEQMKENRERARLRDSIAKRANSLMDMLVKPEKGKHVPTKLQDSVLKVLEMLDINSERADYHGTETQKSKDYQGSVRWLRYFYDEVWDRQSKGETPEELDGLMMTLSERNIMDIRDAIDIFSLDGGVMVLRDMDSSQLKMVDTLLKTVKQSIDSIGKLWRIQRYESIVQLGDASIAEMDSRGPQKITNSTVGGARDFFVLDNLEPVSYGERLGEAGAEVIQSLMDGQKIKFGKIREASEATEKMLKEIGLRSYGIGKWRKHVQTVTLGGKNVRMTDAMLMSLYLTAKRPQGRQHLLANGMRIPTTDRTGGQVKTILLSEADLTYAAGLLSDKQRQLADRMGEYLSTAVAKWGNDVTQRLYLYDAFTEKFYWPITSDPNVLKTQEPEGERAFNAIINAEITKPVNQKATNAVIVTDAFDVFGNHIGEMASYAGYAEAMTDTMAWLNYKQRNSETRLVEGSVKESMESLLGKGGIQYLTNLVQDINGARRGGDNMQLNKLLGNYKKAAVMGKIRVAIQQATSIVRAAAEINPWYLIKGLRPTKGLPKGKSIGEWLRSNGTVEEMQKWSNLAWWKAHGNYDIGIGKGMDAILWGDTSISDTAMEKIATQGGLVDPGKMDDLTWAHMWLAVKSEIKRKRKDLEVGSDEFFRAVAERFEYVMDRTQVVDTVMHRSALMRGKDGLVKSLTSFMSEATKSYNMLMRAVMEVGRHPKDGAAHKKLARTTLAYVASAAATAAMTALYDAFRYRDDEDDVWTYLQGRYWGNVWQQMLKAMISNVNPLSNIPIIADVYDMTVNDGNAPTVMAFEGIADLISAAQTVNNYMNGNNSRKSTVYGVIKPVLTAASSLCGLPLTGILTNVETIGRVFDPKWMQTKSEYATQGKAYEKLYEAIRDGNKEKAADIRRRLKEGLYGAAPKNPKEIDTGIAKYLALDDERIMKYWQMREKGNQYREMVALRKEIQKDGFTEEHVVQAGNRIESLLNNQYNEYLEDGMTGDAKELKEYAAKYDMVLEEAAAKDMEEELDPKMFQYDHLFAAIRNGDLDDVEGVAGVMEMESEAEDPEEAIRNQVSGEFREEYIAAARGGSTAKVRDLDKKLDYFGIDAEDRAAWIKKDRYEDLGEALEAGKTGKADEYVEQLRESGVSDDDIASSVSSRFKETYIDLVVKGKDDEAEELAEMLRDLGLVTPKGKNKYRQDVLDDWVEAWYKAQEEE